jgi:peptidoglycan/xylan/chitin deacetylase (PgdA/CDA1 family)
LFNIGIGQEMQMHTLRWLKQNNVPATIFPMGWWAIQNQDDMREMAMLGFPIGTHGDTRMVLTEHTDYEVLNDLRSSATKIKQVTGTEPVPYFTPYAAAIDERVRSLVASEGYLPVAWDVSAADWDVDITADFVYERVVSNVEDGSIVEFHLDGPSSAQSTAVAIPWIVESLRAKGFTFVTVQDMAQPCGAATPVPPNSVPMAERAKPLPAAGTPRPGS